MSRNGHWAAPGDNRRQQGTIRSASPTAMVAATEIIVERAVDVGQSERLR